MPYRHSTEQIKADAANAARRICPECLKPVEKGNGVYHVAEHYPRYADLDSQTDAARRARLILAMDAEQKEGA